MTDYFDYRVIESRDPSGWESQPSERDYANFRAWVSERYGAATLRSYYGTSWALTGTDPI